LLRTVLILFTVWITTGCQTIYYYGQAIDGQLGILMRREPIEELIEDPEIDETLKHRLFFILDVRKFAQADLHLPVENNYLSYVDLNRSYVMWNVFAAPEFSLEPKTWCYPIAGCVAYRGYFSKTDAKRYADTLEKKNLDVYVGGVSAYSTLGWFEDPVLSTMMRLSETDSAALIFHELAHKLLYIPGDSAFNESFASAVEQEGVRRWLMDHGDRQAYKAYLLKHQKHRQFVDLIMQYRSRFEALYQGQEEMSAQRIRKAAFFEQMIDDHDALKEEWGGTSPYDNWFGPPLNNAKLASVLTYHNWVPAFNAMLAAENGDLVHFYKACQELAKLAKAERNEILATYANSN
jgi:predicted aminopeptidase